MDDDSQSNNQPIGNKKIDIAIGGSSQSPANSSVGNTESPVLPPAPGEVVTGSTGSTDSTAGPTLPPSPSAYGAGPAGGPPPKVVVSGGGGGKRWLKILLIIILIAAIVAGGWYAYTKYIKKSPAPKATSQSETIPLLKIGVQSADYGNLYPDMSVNDYGYSTNAQMFEGLVRYENVSKIAPDLASDWKNPDSKTWVFTIRKNIKFHDGHTLAPSDVKYSLDKIIASNSDLAQAFASTIASVDVVGDSQVKITTKDPDPTLLNKLTFLYVIDANLPQGDEPSQAGTGPYEIKPGTTPTNRNVQMVAFNGYHEGRPMTQALVFGNVDSSTGLIKSFQGRQYDIVGYVDPAEAKSIPAVHFVTSGPDVNYIAFNTVKPGPLQNKLVREAIRYAVNAGSIGQASDSQVTPLSQLIPPSVPGYNPAITPYKQDIDKAKQLLTQAGYPNGLNLRFSTSSDSAKSSQEIADELKKAGITVTMDTHTNFDEFINYFDSGQAELFTVDYTSDTLDGLDIYNTTLNSANYNNPKLNDLLTQASTTVDPAKRLKLLQDAATIIDQDVAIVPLSTQNNLWLMNKNYAIKQDMPSGYMPVYFYKVHN